MGVNLSEWRVTASTVILIVNKLDEEII